MSSDLHFFDGVRTAFSRSGTSLAGLDAVELGRVAASALFTRTGIDPALVDETIFGCVSQPADAANISRVIALRAGVPKEKPAMTVHRNCASGMQAVTTAQEKLSTGQGHLFLVGGTESMSQTPLLFRHEAALKFAMLSRAKSFTGRVRAATAFRLQDFMPLIALKMGLTDPIAELNMGETAEVLAREFSISREEQDAFAVRSHHLAAVHREALAAEATPVFVGKSKVQAIVEDNGVRMDSSLAKLARLQPLFDPVMGSVTAGNASQITDGAAALLVGDIGMSSELGVKPIGRLVSFAYTGCDPARMGLGPVNAMRLALDRAGWRLKEMDVIEINEAFAAQVLAVLRHFPSLNFEMINKQGGAIALGHPVGATGARLILSALRQLQHNGGGRALVSLCVGGGQGGAVCLESV